MGILMQQQQTLLRALFDAPDGQALRGLVQQGDAQRLRALQAYRGNGQALAQRALLAAYPVLEQLLGSESFASLACAFWYWHPPQYGDLAQWGEALAGFIGQQAQLDEEPYLADVARLEWLRHLAQSAADAVPDQTSFALLGERDPQQLTLRLASGCAVLGSRWPVASLVEAHLGAPLTLAEAAQRLQRGVPEHALVWRQGHRVCMRQLAPSEHTLLAGLLAGLSLSDALEQSAPADLSTWLVQAVQEQLVIGVSTLCD